MIFVDTGYLLAQAKPRDALHERATAWTAALREPLLTTEFVLVELADGLSSPFDRAKLHATLDYLRRLNTCEIVPASSALFERGLQLHAARGDKKWSLTDCISFVVMQERGIPRALAYDHHFEQAGFEALLWREVA
jgi:predicted nucleic acid-binding protein